MLLSVEQLLPERFKAWCCCSIAVSKRNSPLARVAGKLPEKCRFHNWSLGFCMQLQMSISAGCQAHHGRVTSGLRIASASAMFFPGFGASLFGPCCMQSIFQPGREGRPDALGPTCRCLRSCSSWLRRLDIMIVAE